MGWVSYLEDIRDRLNDSLKGAELALKQAKSNAQIDEQKDRLKFSIAECKAFVGQLESLVDLATDPQVDLATENLLLGERLRQTELRIGLDRDRIARAEARVKEAMEREEVEVQMGTREEGTKDTAKARRRIRRRRQLLGKIQSIG